MRILGRKASWNVAFSRKESGNRAFQGFPSLRLQELLKAEGDVLRAHVLFSRAMRAKSRACTARVIEI